VTLAAVGLTACGSGNSGSNAGENTAEASVNEVSSETAARLTTAEPMVRCGAPAVWVVGGCGSDGDDGPGECGVAGGGGVGGDAAEAAQQIAPLDASVQRLE
jgi:hypothetical protein